MIVWIVAAGAAGVALWLLNERRRLFMRNAKLQEALKNAKIQVHQLEEEYAQKQGQQQNTANRLRSYLRLMDTLINTIPNPIYLKDRAGIYQGCNNVFAKEILGLTRDRIIGTHNQELTDHIPPELADVYQHQELMMIKKDGYHSFESEVLCADGRRREYLFTLAPVEDHQGEPDGHVAVLSDLTEKNRAARDRLQKEKLEGVLETAGAVCHELNQPLQALSGFTEILGMKIADNREAAEYISKITEQMIRMRDIIDKLHGVTRYETTDYAGTSRIIDIRKASE